MQIEQNVAEIIFVGSTQNIHTDLLLNIESMYKMFSERNLLTCNTFYALAERRPDIKCPSQFVFYALTLISLVQLLDNFYTINLPIIYRSSSYLVIIIKFYPCLYIPHLVSVQ